MRSVLVIVATAFVIAHFYVLRMNKNAAVKRVAYRWLMIVTGLGILVFTAITVEDLVLMVFVIPVVAFVVFMSLRCTKFCDWCGEMVRTNLPFVNKSLCRRCGSALH